MTETKKQDIGARLPRKEDERLMRGQGLFVGDISMPGLQDVAFFRSPIADGTGRRVDNCYREG